MSIANSKGTILLFLGLALIEPRPVLGERLPTTVFSARDGVAPSDYHIVVDSKGFMWFAGSEGLARFDGNGFRKFTEADGLPAGGASIFERADATYWVAAQEQLCLFDPRSDRRAHLRCLKVP